jgi:S1-C subfamily serine protease
MKLNRFAGALCVSLIFSAPFAKALTTTEIVQQAKPAVVLIEGLNSQTGKEQLGTGFFVDPVTIVTNDHVMRGTYDKLAVHRLDGTYFTIDYVAFTSQQHDICVLRTKEESSDWLNLSATLPLEGEPRDRLRLARKWRDANYGSSDAGFEWLACLEYGRPSCSHR